MKLVVADATNDDPKTVPRGAEAYGRLVSVGLWVRKDADEHLIDVGLTVVELVILRQHIIHEVLDIRGIARMMKYSPTHIANLIRGLVQRGFLERVPQQRDRRYSPTCITERGRALHDEAHEAKDVGRAFEAISEEELRFTYHALKDIRAIDPDFARGKTGMTRGELRRDVIARREGIRLLPGRPRRNRERRNRGAPASPESAPASAPPASAPSSAPPSRQDMARAPSAEESSPWMDPILEAIAQAQAAEAAALAATSIELDTS